MVGNKISSSKATVFVAISTLLTGLVPYLVPMVGARILNAENLAFLLSSLTIVTTITLSLNSPLDFLIPKIFHRNLNEVKNEGENLSIFVLATSMGLGIFASTLLLIYFLLFDFKYFELIFYLVLFTLSSSIFSALRSLLSGTYKFQSLVVVSAIYCFFGSALLAASLFFNLNAIQVVILLLTISNIAPLFWLFLKSKNTFVIKVFIAESRKTLNLMLTGEFRSKFIIIMSLSILTLVINNGYILGSRIMKIEPLIVVQIAALTSLTRIPLTLLNSVSPLILNQATKLTTNENGQALNKLFNKSISGILLFLLITFTSFNYLAEKIIHFYLGEQYIYDRWLAAAVIFTECLIALMGFIRIFLISIDCEKYYLKLLTLGFFILVIGAYAAEFDPVFNLFSALVVGSTVVIFFATYKFKRVIFKQI